MVLVLNEVRRHVLEPAGDIDSDPVLLLPAALARPLGLRDLDLVHAPLDPARLPARAGLAPLPLGLGPGLLGTVDLAIELRVLLGLRLRVDLRLRILLLADESFEQKRELRGVDPLGLAADPLPAQLRHQELELTVLDEDRFKRREEELPCLVHLALIEQRPSRLADLPKRRQLRPWRRRSARRGHAGFVQRAALVFALASRRLRTISCAFMAINSATPLLKALPSPTRRRTSSTASCGTCSTRFLPSTMKVSVQEGWPCPWWQWHAGDPQRRWLKASEPGSPSGGR